MKGQETYQFKSEVKQLLHIMIHSLYSNKEIFLRELISNASDAADKLRFLALSKPDLYEDDTDLRVRISFNNKERTLTISDNGIGMTRQEVIDNIGTIAKSGTKIFLKNFSSNKIQSNQVIGQFGVGFYSAFIVANTVILRTRAAGHDIHDGVYWESNGEGDYTVSNINKKERGTDIILCLRKNEDEFLDYFRLKNIINKYSDHISLLIEIESHSKNIKTSNNEKLFMWEKVNQAKALWTRKKIDISNKEYKDFYKYLTHDTEDPLVWTHNQVEGKQEYISLLYIPSKSPSNILNHEYKHGLKLYVRRVFIMNDAEQFIPNYLRFIKGLIDSNDLPLNISREILQDNNIIHSLKEALIKRVLSMLDKLSTNNKDCYLIFWQQFGTILKEGLAEDVNNSKIIAKLLRFASTKNDSAIQNISLDDYLNRMKKDQEKIYYITADNYLAAKNSPHLELFNKNQIEVLLLFDRIDEWTMNHLTKYDNKSLQSISKFDSSLHKLIKDEKIENSIVEEDFKSVIKKIKKYLGDRIKDVCLTYRLSDTPSIVTTDANEITTQMAKLFAAAGQTTPKVKYIFEINPKHELIKHIAHIVDENEFNEWIELLFEEALLVECGSLHNPSKFISRINKLLNI